MVATWHLLKKSNSKQEHLLQQKLCINFISDFYLLIISAKYFRKKWRHFYTYIVESETSIFSILVWRKSYFNNKTQMKILNGKKIKITSHNKHRGKRTIHDKTLVNHRKAQSITISSSSYQDDEAGSISEMQSVSFRKINVGKKRQQAYQINYLTWKL